SQKPTRRRSPSTFPAAIWLTAVDMLSRLAGLSRQSSRKTAMPAVSETPALRCDWSRAEIQALFDLPFPELLHRAASVHRANFDPAEVQVSTLLSVKTGGCPEDCAYCPQAQRYHTGVDATKLMTTGDVLEKARQAKAAGASRFCMGAAWRS